MITIIGNLCNNGLVLQELFSRFNIESQLIFMPHDPPLKCKLLKFTYVNNSSVIKWDNKKIKEIFCKNILPSNTIISNTASILAIGFKKYIELRLRRKINHFNIATGSDFSEFLSQGKFLSKLFRYHVKNSKLNWIFPVSNILENIIRVQPNNLFIAPHPFLVESYETVRKYSLKMGLNGKVAREKIVFLHASNLDWGKSDDNTNRKSTKGNDIFLSQFIRSTDISQNIHCYIIDRGPDRNEAKKIIKEFRKESFFTWLPPVNSEDLSEYISLADVVVDQFVVGCPGMISMEAMAQAKPVMIYIDKNYWPLVYNEEPPVINCHTEDEIYKAILEWADKKKLKDLGEKAEKWVRKYHDVHTADFSEFILRVCLAAGLEWPRKDLAKQDK